MSHRRILAIAADADRLRNLVTSLERAGGEVDGVTDPSQIPGDVLPHRYVFFASAGKLGDLQPLLPRLRPKAHVAGVVPKASLSELVSFLKDSRCNHVICGEDEERGVYVTARKLLTGDIFGIEKYLPPDTPVNYFRLRDYLGRGTAIDTILKYAEDSRIRRQVRSAIGQVCEELLMNALYDAPVDETGAQLFADVDPHDRLESMSPRPVSIRYAATDSQFLVAVRDRFGRLAKNTILAYIHKCLTSSQQIDRKTYGAGLGLYLVANATAGYVVNVAHGMATEVVCSFDRGTKAPLRLVGVFVHPGMTPATTGKPEPAAPQDGGRGGAQGDAGGSAT